jgi:hypothetical protein
MYPLASFTTLTANAEGSFLSIPQNYNHLQLRIFARTNVGSASLSAGFTTSFDCPYLRFNGDATAANYADHKLTADGVTIATTGAAGTITAMRAGIMPISTSPTGTFSSTIIDILDYSSTSKNKVVKYMSGVDNNGSGYVVMGSGLWVNTAAINQIYIGGFTGGYSIGSRFDLYGISTSSATGV